MRFTSLAPVLAVLALARCAAPVPVDPGGEAIVYVIERGWHTDIGIPVQEISGSLAAMEAGYPGVRYLTFGFGERQFLVDREHGILTTISAVLPSKSAVLMTALAASPQEAFGEANVVTVHVGQAALDAMEANIWREFELQPDGRPVFLASGPYPGSNFYAGRNTYAGYFTCNTWTAETLRAGGLLDSSRGVLFSGQVMGLARRIAARQAGG